MALSQRGSEIIYTRSTDGLPRVARNFQLGVRQHVGWGLDRGSTGGRAGKSMPFATLDAGDPLPSIHYQPRSRRSPTGVTSSMARPAADRRQRGQ